jgi:hypothetical protein
MSHLLLQIAFLLNAALAMEILDLISCAHFESLGYGVK